MEAYAKKHDIDLMFFCGSPFEAPQSDVSHYNSIYNLVNTSKLDGLIIATSSLGNYIGKTRLEKYINRYANIPTVSISFEYPDYQTIQIDNAGSIRKILDHLIVYHGYKDIALITGPKTNVDSIERFESYKETLKHYDIPFNEKLVTEGKFNRDSVQKCIEELYDINKMNPQIIVCCNDDMAIGAYFELKKRGIVVGKDVFITGFDDLDEVDSFNPPFTTIRLPWFQMGYEGMTILCDRIDNRPFEMMKKLRGELIVRESCGCLNVLVGKLDPEIQDLLVEEQGKKAINENFDLWLSNNSGVFFDIIAKEVLANNNEHVYPAVFEQLVDAFRYDVRKQISEGQFLKLLNVIVNNSSEQGYDIDKWQNALYMINQYIRKSPLNKDLLLLVDDIFYLANTLIGNIMKRTEHYNTFLFRDMYYSTSQLIESFNTVLLREELYEILEGAVEGYALDVFCLCMFDETVIAINNGQYDYPLSMTLRYGKVYNQTYRDIRYTTSEMIPDVVSMHMDRESLVYFPIHFKDKHYGYLITNTVAAEKLIFRTIREQIGNTLDRISVYAQLEQYNRELERISIVDTLTGLYNRRGFYELGEALFKEAKNNHQQVAIVYGDLDGLKVINDQNGHSEGDYAIAFIGTILKEKLLKDGLAGRIGGDEFIVLLSDIKDEKKIMQFIQSIETGIKLENEHNDKPYEIAMSFGFALLNRGEELSFDELIISADRELYIEKERRKAMKNPTLRTTSRTK